MARNRHKTAHKALLRDVAELIGQPVDSLAVRFVALARLKLDATEAQLLSGDTSVSIQDVNALEETLARYIPKPSMQITVRYVEPADSAPADHAAISGLAACRRCSWAPAGTDRWPACPACGWRVGDDVSAPHTPIAAPPASPENLSTGSPVPHNVVPIDGKRAAELRAAARVSNGVDPGPPRNVSPCIGSPFLGGGGGGDNRTISQWQRDVDNAYRGY
jgi:hypothetical protein